MLDPIEQLDRQLRELQRRLDTLTGHDSWLDVSDYAHRLGGLDERVTALDDNLDDLEVSVQTLQDSAGDTASALRGLEHRVRLLERRIRSSATIAAADLDNWPPPCAKLASAIRAGQQAESQLLRTPERTRWQQTIDRPDQLRAEIEIQRRTALSAADRLTRLSYSDKLQRRQALGEWTAASETHENLVDQFDDAQSAARRARECLNEAITRHETAQPLAERGQQAQSALTTRVRTRISDAIRDDLLFPGWFETALGPGAPHDAAPWLSVAVQIVAYRLIYDITDPVLALGLRPHQSGRQQRDFDRLTGQSRGLPT